METDSENNEEYHEEKKRKLPIFGEKSEEKNLFLSRIPWGEDKKVTNFWRKSEEKFFSGKLKKYLSRILPSPSQDPTWFTGPLVPQKMIEHRRIYILHPPENSVFNLKPELGINKRWGWWNNLFQKIFPKGDSQVFSVYVCCCSIQY